MEELDGAILQLIEQLLYSPPPTSQESAWNLGRFPVLLNHVIASSSGLPSDPFRDGPAGEGDNVSVGGPCGGAHASRSFVETAHAKAISGDVEMER